MSMQTGFGPRTEYSTNPLGIDAVPPRLSWCHDRLGAQVAYRIRAASTPRVLQAGEVDRWDSGRVEGAEHCFVPYGGPAPVSGERVYWRVQTWHADDATAESDIAWFEMGLLKREDWQGQFLAVPCAGGGGRGFLSKMFAADERHELWVQVDLGREETFDRFVLHPIRCPEMGAAGDGLGFPIRFRLEVAADEAFTHPQMLFETADDVPATVREPSAFRLPEPASARFVRLTVTKPYTVPPQSPPAGTASQVLFGLDELELFRGSVNVASGARVQAPNRVESQIAVGSYDWHPDCLVDGVIHTPEVRRDRGRGNLLRHLFRVEKPVVRARAYIASRGWHELGIDGAKVGDAVLDSAWTAFDKRLLYSTWDVTPLVQPGEHVVTILVGNGWTLDPAVILQLNAEHPDGSRTQLCTDGQWRLLPSPIRENHVYHGETYDAAAADPAVFTPGYDDRRFPFAETRPDYRPTLSSQMQPPIRAVEELSAVRLMQPLPGVWVFDLGRYIAGWAKLRLHSDRRQEVRLRFAETIFDDGAVWTDAAQTSARRAGDCASFAPVFRLYADREEAARDGLRLAAHGMINNANYRVARATDRYVCRGDGREETWEPRFTYHGFRFVEVTGHPGPLEPGMVAGVAVRTDVRPVGRFSCSIGVLNWAFEAATRTFQNNIHSVFTDCCQRDERQGWGGDSHTVCESMLFTLDTASTYIKWLRDARDCQRADGAFGDTAPYSLGRMGGDIAWGCTWVLVAWHVYLHTGDRGMLEEHFPAMHRYLEFVECSYPERFADNATYGDWLSLEDTPRSLVENAYWFRAAQVTARCAAILGREAERGRWEAAARDIALVFHRRLFDAGTGDYGSGSQTSNVLPLRFGMVPSDLRQTVFARLVANVEKRGRHLSTGVHGTKWLLEVLCEFGRPDLALDIVSAEDFPGWGNMKAHGATTLWEHWEHLTGPGMNSHNHPTFGSVAAWMMKCLAGIRPDPLAPGFRHIALRPHFPEGLDHAAAELNTPHGLLRSAWRRDEGRVHLEIRIPDGCSATVHNRLRLAAGAHEVRWETGGRA